MTAVEKGATIGARLDGGLPTNGNSPEMPSWFRCPEIILIQQPHIGKVTVPSHHRTPLLEMKNQLFADYQIATTTQLGYAARVLSTPDDKTTGPVPNRIVRNNNETKEIRSPYGIILDPVLYGTLPVDAYEIMKELRNVESRREDQGKKPLFFDEQGRKPLMYAFRDTLPQIEIPLVLIDGSTVIRNLDMDMKKMRGNFANVVFVHDQLGVIDNLPTLWRQTLHWMVIAKLGSFKVVIVRYWEGENGLEMAKPMIATLEGGHYPLDAKRMIAQLAVFGSSQATGRTETLRGVSPIPLQTWRESQAVKGLKAFGKTLGELQLVSPGITVEDVVSEDGVIDFIEEELPAKEDEGKIGRLKRFAVRAKRGLQETLTSARMYREEAAGYSRQAEGAFYHFDPENNLFIVTASGRFGAVKTNLGDEDLTAVLPAPGDPTLVYQLPVEHVETRDSSVEAREFIGPIHESFISNDPKFDQYKVRVVREDGIYRPPKKEEIIDPSKLQIWPAIIGIVHLHRDRDIENLAKLIESGEIVEITLPDQLVVGCGVDIMEDQSRRAMGELIQKWNQGGREAKMGFVRVGRHGINWFMLATATRDPERDIDVLDPYAFKEFVHMLEREENPLHLTDAVIQEHYPVTIFQAT